MCIAAFTLPYLISHPPSSHEKYGFAKRNEVGEKMSEKNAAHFANEQAQQTGGPSAMG